MSIIGDLFGLAPEAWTQDAVCVSVDPECWFPNKGDSTTVRKAKLICDTCPCISECLDYAMRNDIRAGVWGGKAVKEREIMRRERNKLRRDAA